MLQAVLEWYTSAATGCRCVLIRGSDRQAWLSQNLGRHAHHHNSPHQNKWPVQPKNSAVATRNVYLVPTAEERSSGVLEGPDIAFFSTLASARAF